MVMRSINRQGFAWKLGLTFLFATSAWSATYTVSKDGRGAFTTISAAIAQAKAGDEIVILDNATYPEQVTIDSTKSGLTLRSSTPTSASKPTIVWQDKANVGPKTCAEAQIEKNVTFDQNGALRVMRARNVVIDGIKVDGGGYYPFGYPGVWRNGPDCNGQNAALFHGNAAIDLWIAGDVVIRNCDISNAYFGINIKDRNEGGVFANPNPADNRPETIVPLSGFGKTGNHVIERNRIHDNSWGMFFESSWDLGSTVRHNLIYSNYHHGAVATEVKETLKAADGGNQPGGAIFLKDDMYSPLAIYNNTFWDNNLLIAAHWRAGVQHLLFNNIFAKPHLYGGDAANPFGNSFMAIDPLFVNRNFNSLFAAQSEAPKIDSQKVQAQEYDQTLGQQVMKDSTPKFYRNVRIMNGMDKVEKVDITINLTLPLSAGPKVVPQTLTQVILPGARITGAATDPFPLAANVRWLEITFKSTSPTSPDFLVPNWDDSIVTKFVKDQGWTGAGVRDADGSIADIGAIPSGGVPTSDIIIKPLSPVIITNTTATLTFNISELSGTINNPTIKYLRWMNNVPFVGDAFGSSKLTALPATTPLTTTGAVLKGGTTLTATVPVRGATEFYAFAEIVIEGTDANGQTVTSNVGFLPYRKIDYKFVVEVYNAEGTQKLTSVAAGQAVKLVITPQKLDGTPFTNLINPVEVILNSGADLLLPGTPTKLTLPAGIQNKQAFDVMFTKIPPGGLEIVRVAGIWQNGGQSIAFLGTSEGIKVLPGAPAKLVFQDPPSKSSGATPVIDPGQQYAVKVQVYDAYDNKVPAPSVSIQSLNKAIGDITGPAQAATDSTGLATFRAVVTNGDLNETFDLKADLPGNITDQGTLKVGKARDKLWIFYADAATGYNPALELRGSAGDRLPVTIRASQDGKTTIATRTNEFTVTVSSGLAVYANLTDATPKNTFNLVAGEVVVYVTGLRIVNNGTVSAAPTTDNTLTPSETREKIYFGVAGKSVKTAFAFADNGVGAVDRIDLTFGEDLKQAPDSLVVSWPTPGANRQVVKAGIVLDPADKKHVTVTLAQPFPAGLIAGTGNGTAYVSDPAAPEEPAQQLNLTLVDKVGPLLDSGKVYEKMGAGVDTLSLVFKEKMASNSLVGPSLLLLKAGSAPVSLNVLAATDLGDGMHYKLIVADLGAQSPVAKDSVKIDGAGSATDFQGNKAHLANRPIPLGLKTVPRAPILKPDFDKPFVLLPQTTTVPNFVVYTPGNGKEWVPVTGGEKDQQATCANNCGPVITEVDGTIKKPAVTILTDRGFKFNIQIFSNLGEFLDSYQGEITNAALGLDERGLTNGSPSVYPKVNGNFVVKVAWNGMSNKGQKAATGAYIARYTVTVQRELDTGAFVNDQRKQDVRFGIIREL